MIKQITKNYSAAGLVFRDIYILLTLMLASTLLYVPTISRALDKTPYEKILLFVGIVLFFTDSIHQILIGKAVKARKDNIAILSAETDRPDAMEVSRMDFSLMALEDKEGIRNPTFSNFIRGTDWAYSDFSYDIYKKTKQGEYLAYTIYYSVIMTRLPRKLPNVLFDSRQARKRQFKMQFASNQLHSLEGDFDKYFATYFPPHYTIDSLSFITPEVMWALRDAAEYDIEIKDDHLFMFGSLRDPSIQIADMASKIETIKKKLLNNIMTYRDERLPYEDGRKQVTELGAQLWYNLTWKYVGLVVSAILTTVVAIFSVKKLHNNPYFTIIGIFWVITYWQAIRKELKRRRLTTRTLEKRQT